MGLGGMQVAIAIGDGAGLSVTCRTGIGRVSPLPKCSCLRRSRRTVS